MQTPTERGTQKQSSPVTGAPPPQDRDEDSGLHDIRSMASSTKLRISSKRITTSPPVDDDILASSSAGWKAVALPEPAKMVSLPELSEIGSPHAEQPPERKSKKELKAERTSAKQIAQQAIAVETSAPVAAAPVAKSPDVPVTPIIGARLAQQHKKSKAGLVFLVGGGLAAAAGVGWYVSTQMKNDAKSSEQVALASSQDREQAPTTQSISAPSGAAGAGSAAPAAIPPAAPEPIPDTTVATGMSEESSEDKPTDTGADASGALADSKARAKAKGKKDANKRDEAKDEKPSVEPPKEAPKVEPKKTGEADGEPSFDALLKEAGVSQDKKPEKIKLEKKSLSSADIKKGMSSIAGKAQGCYAGQQGTAQVKLTVNPDGKIAKVKVTGVFGGTPVGACVESAVKGAAFPPWEGGPQSFGYSYLLAE